MEKVLASLFLSHSARKLEQMVAAITLCLDRLSDEQIWRRGSAQENSIGNLVLHLCGNVKQWVGHGVGGNPDVRNRPAEFAALGGVPATELAKQLHAVVDGAILIIQRQTPESLARTVEPQGYEVSALEAIYDVVGHFQQHTGQIVFATKQFTGEDMQLS